MALESCAGLGFSMRDTVICIVVWLVSRGMVVYCSVSFLSGVGAMVGDGICSFWNGVRYSYGFGVVRVVVGVSGVGCGDRAWGSDIVGAVERLHIEHVF